MSERTGYNIVDQYGLYFVTFTIVGWVDVFSRKECKQIIIDALRYCIANKGLVVHAYVIMESHIHLILSATEESQGLSAIIRDFKKHTSKEILKWVRQGGRESRKEWMLIVFKYHAKYNKRNAEYQVWQQDNRPKELYYPRFIMQKIGYIHRNPVVAGIVDEVGAYLHSSARNYQGRADYLLEIQVIDFGVQEGFIPM
ncbi:MAG: transposase [Saprospiraceae bacterium]|nr:transposase [Lewinella sp.]